MNETAPSRRIWLCADDYGISPGVNRAIRELIKRGRLNATSVMVVGPAIGRDEVASLQDVVAERNAWGNRFAVGLHVTLTAPFRPLTMHFRPADGGMFLPLPKMLQRGDLGAPDRCAYHHHRGGIEAAAGDQIADRAVDALGQPVIVGAQPDPARRRVVVHSAAVRSGALAFVSPSARFSECSATK